MSLTAERFRKPSPRKRRSAKQKQTKSQMRELHVIRARKHLQMVFQRGKVYGCNPANAVHQLRLSDKMKRNLGPRPRAALTIALDELIGCGAVIYDHGAYRRPHRSAT